MQPDQTEMLKRLWQLNGGGPVSLRGLLEVISHQEDGRGACYFAGTISDHDFFIRNDVIALGISVLPEDAKKAGRKRSHPHQTEVIVGLEGRCRLCIGRSAKDASRYVVEEGDVRVIRPGMVHWIEPIHEDGSAAFLFVKTHPGIEPSVVEHDSTSLQD